MAQITKILKFRYFFEWDSRLQAFKFANKSNTIAAIFSATFQRFMSQINRPIVVRLFSHFLRKGT